MECLFPDDHSFIFCFPCYPLDSSLSSLFFLHFKDELASSNHRGSKSSTPTHQGSVSKSGSKSNNPMSSQGGTSISNTPTSTYSANSQSTTPLSRPDGVSTGMSPVSSLGGGSASATPQSAAASDVAMEPVDMPLQEGEVSEGLNKNLDRNSWKPESSKNIAAVREGERSQLGQDGQVSASTPLKGDGQNCS